MGRSPGKWIKTVLFGKKSSRSHASKGREALQTANNKEHSGRNELPAIGIVSPVISHPIPVNSVINGVSPELQKEAHSSLLNDGTVTSPANQEKLGSTGSAPPNDPVKIKEEQAAIKAQAAFRGYLARRAFRALKGIIRLQALIRGHLVRRQAVATLHCMMGIVKLQALVRGRRVRLSGIGFDVHTNFSHAKVVDGIKLEFSGRSFSTQKVNLSGNAFVCKLLSPSPVAMPLQIHYLQEEPNAVLNWLERWSAACIWKPLILPKQVVDLKSQTKQGHYATESETGRPKRSVRRNFTASTDIGSINTASESEKPKRNLRKVSSQPAESVHENPQSELEKVKRSLRKVSNSMAQVSDRTDMEIEKPKRSMKKITVSQPDVPDQTGEDHAEKSVKDAIPLSPGTMPSMESAASPVTVDASTDAFCEALAVNVPPLQDLGREENLSTNGELVSKEDQACQENQKTNKRRASLSAKSEYTENGSQNTPALPSYMAATESAKAKLRGQSTPRIGSDSGDKNGFTRRHSLPSSMNGKVTSQSPRTQRLVLTGGKCGVRSDRSLLSSRDGNEKPIQVEWRR